MNKNLLLISLTLALGLSGVGCNKAGKLDQLSTFRPPSGPVELKLKWPVGERTVQSFDMKMNTETSMPNQPQPVKQDITMGQEYALTVLKEDASGGHEVEMEFLSARMAMMMGGKTMIEYDSTKKSSDKPKDPRTAMTEESIAAMFQNLIGTKLQYFLDASNHVERIEGIDALVAKLGTGGQTDVSASLKSIFSEEYFKKMIESSQTLPHQPVQPGDTWPMQMEIPLGSMGTMAMDQTVTFDKWEQHGKRMCARLEFQGTIKGQPGKELTPGGMSMSIKDGNLSGVSWFDPELGKVIETSGDQDINMAITMPINIQGKMITQTMTSQMKQQVTAKLESVK
jgi:hypothetical protein